jgi:hypothetical protein
MVVNINSAAMAVQKTPVRSNLLLELMYLPGSPVFPVTPLLQGPVECNRPGARAIVHTTPAIPAFIRVQDYRWFTFLRIGYIYIYLAYFHTMVAAVAYFFVENGGLARRGNIRYSF